MVFGLDLSFLWTALQSALPIIIGGGLFVGLMWYLSKNSAANFKANYLGLAIQAVRWVETYFENSPNQYVSKADAALKKFIDLYTAHTGDTPSQALQDWFNVVKEEILLDLEKASLTASSPTPAPVVPVPTAVALAPVAPTTPPATPAA